MIAIPSLDASRLVLHSEVAELDRLAAWVESFAQHSTLSADITAVRLRARFVLERADLAGACGRE
jgi:hypothetical protein